jgi:tetratricopeptide (TPR) repeat protein
MATGDQARIEAAAIFQLDIGVALAGVSSASAKQHLDLGGDLVEKVRTAPGSTVSTNEFRSIWYGVAGSAYAATKDLQRARPLLSKALDIEPRSARALTLFGIMHEVDAGFVNVEDWQTLIQLERMKFTRLNLLGLAEDRYREAIRYDPAYARAHIRLGRVLHLMGRLADAAASLERGAQDAKDPLDQYFAALFVGALRYDQKDPAAARQAYEHALSLKPASQTVAVALGHLELMAGRPDRAQLLARRFAAAPPEPWWGYKDGAFDLTGLQWLRARVRR